jgi:uncharacterized protein (TIGR03083 family)
MTDWMRAAADERHDLADFLQTLTDGQWASPSLCEGWSVHDVVAHLVSYEQIGYLGVAAGMVRAGFRLNRLNQIRLDATRDRHPAQLIEFLRAHLTPRGLTAGAGGRIGLTDGLIHHQDIRRAVGRPRDVPVDRLLVVLPYSLKAPVLPSKGNAAGLRAVASDHDWQHGNGPEVHGPAEALLMAFAGRTDALDDLGGPGVEILRTRLQRQTGGRRHGR